MWIGLKSMTVYKCVISKETVSWPTWPTYLNTLSKLLKIH